MTRSALFLVLGLMSFGVSLASAAPDYGAIVKNWYEKGVEGGDTQLVMDTLSDDIQWWCFGPAGFTMNDYYQGKDGVGQFFDRLGNELVVDTAQNFRVHQMDVSGNVVNVYGLEKGTITPFVKQNAPALKGDTFYNYFNHRLELNEQGKITRFRCNWALFDHPVAVAPF